MGAISTTTSLPILKEFLTDSNRSVRETCEIALAKIEWDNSPEGQKYASALSSTNDTPYVHRHLSILFALIDLEL
jgi:deoxyhypusine monooxygenase